MIEGYFPGDEVVNASVLDQIEAGQRLYGVELVIPIGPPKFRLIGEAGNEHKKRLEQEDWWAWDDHTGRMVKVSVGKYWTHRAK